MELLEYKAELEETLWICWSLGHFAELTKKLWAWKWGPPPFWTQTWNSVFPDYGLKFWRIQFFFLLKFSICIGPMYGIINIFSFNQPLWLYIKFWFRDFNPFSYKNRTQKSCVSLLGNSQIATLNTCLWILIAAAAKNLVKSNNFWIP